MKGYSISVHSGRKGLGNIAIGHNIRDPKFVEKQTHIDPNGDHEIWIDGRDLAERYNEIFEESVTKYNDKLKQAAEEKNKKIRKNRLQPYDQFTKNLENKKIGEKNIMTEVVVEIGDKDNHPDNETSKKILKEYVEKWQKENTNAKIIGCYYHGDEATPHIHLDYVLVGTKGYKQGLEIQPSAERAFEEMGITKDSYYKEEVYNSKGEKHTKNYTQKALFADRLRDQLEEIMNANNLERKKGKSPFSEHYDPKEYKEKKEEYNKLENTFKEKESDYEYIKRELKKNTIRNENTKKELKTNKEELENINLQKYKAKNELINYENKIKEDKELLQGFELELTNHEFKHMRTTFQNLAKESRSEKNKELFNSLSQKETYTVADFQMLLTGVEAITQQKEKYLEYINADCDKATSVLEDFKTQIKITAKEYNDLQNQVKEYRKDHPDYDEICQKVDKLEYQNRQINEDKEKYRNLWLNKSTKNLPKNNFTTPKDTISTVGKAVTVVKNIYDNLEDEYER